MSTQNTGSAPQKMDKWFLDLLVCPGCEQRHPLQLTPAQDALLCACGRYSFPVRDGIPILLVEEAVVLNKDADPTAVKDSRE